MHLLKSLCLILISTSIAVCNENNTTSKRQSVEVEDPCKFDEAINDFSFPTATQQLKKRFRRAATSMYDRIWTEGVIPYEIDEIFGGKHTALFKKAMRHWENFTCIKFVERNEDEHQDYIVFTEKPCGCCSFVGRRGNGGQAVSIGRNCDQFGFVVHELGHAVGFWHEHARPDRDNYVRIIKENIMSGQEHNFNKMDADKVNSLGLRYDYNSIMHYARNTYAKSVYFETIQPIEPNDGKLQEIGQRVRLSDGDIAQTNLLYKCPTCGQTFQTHVGWFQSPNYARTNALKPEVTCEWRISATHGEKIILNITDFDLKLSQDCSTDYIEIKDGYWSRSPLLGRLCGSGSKHIFQSTGNRLLVTYATKNPNGHRGFEATYEAICGGEIFVDNQGHLESPNYPGEYPPDKKCTWRIKVPENHQIGLRFQFFELEKHEECVFDYVEIVDGTNRLLFCGSQTPPDFTSNSSELLVRFVSDGSVQKLGFSATVLKEFDECVMIDNGCSHTCVNTLSGYHCECDIGFQLNSNGKSCQYTCGGVLEATSGNITSPSFPDLYPKNKTCTWEIVSKPQDRIVLNFTYFDLEGEAEECDYDWVRVSSRIHDELIFHGVYCGSKSPGSILSQSNIMRIVFNSDDSYQNTGFAAVFYSDKDECASNNGGCHHKCINTIESYRCACQHGFNLHHDGHTCTKNNCTQEITSAYGTVTSPNYPGVYPNDQECVWRFETTPGHRIRVSFFFIELEIHENCFFDYIHFYDGPSIDSHTLAKLCGRKRPPPILSSSSSLYMIFKSDATVQKKGFWASYLSVCGGVFQANATQNLIYSHANFGASNYDNEMDCDWVIEAVDGFRVKISFLSFDLEDGANCENDYVEVFGGVETSDVSYGRFCGSQKPRDIVSLYGDVLVRLKTDDMFTSKGFSLVYEAVEESFGEYNEV